MHLFDDDTFDRIIKKTLAECRKAVLRNPAPDLGPEQLRELAAIRGAKGGCASETENPPKHTIE